jgi:hypothetical protein
MVLVLGATASGAIKIVSLGIGGGGGFDALVNIGSETPRGRPGHVINTPAVTFPSPTPNTWNRSRSAPTRRAGGPYRRVTLLTMPAEYA